MRRVLGLFHESGASGIPAHPLQTRDLSLHPHTSSEAPDPRGLSLSFGSLGPGQLHRSQNVAIKILFDTLLPPTPASKINENKTLTTQQSPDPNERCRLRSLCSKIPRVTVHRKVQLAHK